MRGAQRIKGLAAKSLQRGARQILWAPDTGVGFGNVLYVWLHAYQCQARGEDARVLVPAHLEPWRGTFPRLWTDLSISRDEVRRTDRRTWSWNSRFGEDFSRDELRSFIEAHLQSAFSENSGTDSDTVTINVRRGDYYSKPHFRGTYSFDIAAYLDVALTQTKAHHGEFTRIVVVSDGIDWCRLKLDSILRKHAGSASYVDASESPQANFLRTAGASRLIGTNSSFSYWAGYVSNVLHGGESHTVMPRFHARLEKRPDAYQVDPAWLIVDDIPGGWDA